MIDIKNKIVLYQTFLISLLVALCLVVVVAFVVPYDPGLYGSDINYAVPCGTPFYGFIPIFGILVFVLGLLWVYRKIEVLDND